jgi:hypothetical protein
MESAIVNWQPVQIYRPFRRHLFRGRLLAAHHRTLQVLPGRNLRDLQWKQGEKISNSAAEENGGICSWYSSQIHSPLTEGLKSALA